MKYKRKTFTKTSPTISNDASECHKNHPSGIKTGINKKVLGMFKDEAAGKHIDEFVGLRAKSYLYKC